MYNSVLAFNVTLHAKQMCCLQFEHPDMRRPQRLAGTMNDFWRHQVLRRAVGTQEQEGIAAFACRVDHVKVLR